MCFNGLLYLQLKKYFMVHGIDIKITSSLSTTINQTPGFPFQDNWSGVQLRGFCPGLPVCPKHSHEPPDKMSGLVRVDNIPHIVICDHELHSRVFLFVLWTNTCCLNWQQWYEQELGEQSSFTDQTQNLERSVK